MTTTDLQRFLMQLVRRELDNAPWKTQAWLAEKLDISQKHLSFLLTGKSHGSIQLWDRILTALEITLDAEEAKP